jgi:hypothetical protein
LGVKVTGTVMDSPVVRVAGSDRSGAPIVKAAPLSTSDETIVDAEAVKVAVAVTDWKSTVGEKLRFEAVSAGVAEFNAPNPKSVPSFVPT